MKELVEGRSRAVREDLRQILRKLYLAFVINDEGMTAAIDAACGIDRRAVFLEELKAFLEKHNEANPI